MNRYCFILVLLYSPNVFAYYTDNIHNQCGAVGSDMTAIFEINSYDCEKGYFLPANALGCTICPDGQTCFGGTFKFHTTESQGILYETVSNNAEASCSVNFPHDMFATFTPNTHTCNPGYYLPVNVDECTICPVNHYCVGGTYTFNENIDQGIESCNGGFAPAGSNVCYAHKLHVGEEEMYLGSTKRTTPSLNVAYGNEVFYANATTTPTPITAGSSHYLKTIYNEQIYYICDDTVYRE